MDDIDQKILALLDKDARMSAAEIGRLVGRSRVAVTDRIERLIEEGEISRFSILRRAKIHRALYEIVLSRSGSCEAIMTKLKAQQVCIQAWSVAGSTDLFMMVETDSLEAIHSLRQKLTAMNEVAQITTHMVTRSFQ